MPRDMSTDIRDALRAHDQVKLKTALDGLNRGEKQAAVRQARSAVVDEMNAALAAQSGSGAAIDLTVFRAELDALDTLLAAI